MCGIAGKIYTYTNQFQANEVQRMLSVINHRGPDDEGTYYNDRIALGQKRLSIVDLSSDGRQPMCYGGRYQIVYNGEVYNYLELRDELAQMGYTFATKTDTEVLLAAYANWGEACLDHLNGMWAFIIYDEQEKTVFCARDRFGVKPLYYYQTNSGISFASEIKEFTLLDDWEAVGNVPRIVDFIMNNGMHDFSNETLFKGVFQIRPGESMLVDLNSNSQEIKTWYHLKDKQKKCTLSFEEASKQFHDLFEDAVRLRLRSDVKVGSCLSGGLDSSSIVCVMNQLLKRNSPDVKQEVVFASNHVGKYDESAYMEAVVKKTGVVKHTVEPSFREIVEKLDEILWHQDEPFGSTSIIAQWDVYEKAHEAGLTVMLDGQGADEYLAGYTSFQKVYFRELLTSFKLKKLWRSLIQYKQLYHNYYYAPYKDLVEMLISRLIPEQWIQRVKEFIKHMAGKATRADYIKNYYLISDNVYSRVRKTATSLRDETISEMMHTSLPKLVHHQDRNAMAHSVESRAPFLDYRLVEFVFNLPSDYKIHLAVTKYVQRRGLSSILPSLITERMDKLGFATPEEVWIKENSAQYRDLLEKACDCLSILISKERILMDFDAQIQRDSSIDSIFWCIICTAAWVRRFNVKLAV